jgi:aconitate hydratase
MLKKMNLFRKIMAGHMASGEMLPGKEVSLRVDQVFFDDKPAPEVFSHALAFGLDRTPAKGVCHAGTQCGASLCASDQTVATMQLCARHGLVFARPGNGCQGQTQLERFAAPGQIAVCSGITGAACGAAAMLTFPCGPAEVARALAHGTFSVALPEVAGVLLRGRLAPWTGAFDLALETVSRITPAALRGKAVEFYGEGARSLGVHQRAQAAALLAQCGAAAVLFASDSEVKKFMTARGRAEEWIFVTADKNPEYDLGFELDLATLEPMAAKPGSPDRVCKISDVAGIKLSQVCMGSCAGSSPEDMALAASVLDGRCANNQLSLLVNPSSRATLALAARGGALETLITSGARILECSCGPCCGISHAPAEGTVSLRSYPQNHQGLYGPGVAKIFLAGPAACAASAVAGEITDPRRLGEYPRLRVQKTAQPDDALLIMPPPPDAPRALPVALPKGIADLARQTRFADSFEAFCAFRADDSFYCDRIIPPAACRPDQYPSQGDFARLLFAGDEPEFFRRIENGADFVIVAGDNFGAGSSREDMIWFMAAHGLRAVIARSYSPVFRRNLAQWAVMPLMFADPADYDRLAQGDRLAFSGCGARLREGFALKVENLTSRCVLELHHNLTPSEQETVLAGGALRRA